MPKPTQITPAHFQTLAQRETLRLWFPPHEPREADPAYRLFHQAKKRMRQLDLPCWRCGVRYKDLNPGLLQPATEANPLAAHQLEAHHNDLEFSLQNGVDIEKWYAASHHWDSTPDDDGFMVQSFSLVDEWLARHPEYGEPPDAKGSAEGVAAWHERVFRAYMESEGNLQQLCDVCHRSTHAGIHHIEYPDWRPLAVWRKGLPAHIQ